MDYINYYKNTQEKLEHIDNNKKEIENEINNNYKVTIEQSKKNKDRIIVISGLINIICDSFNVNDKKSFFKDNIHIEHYNYSYIEYNTKIKVLEIHLYKSCFFSSWTISNIIEDILIQLCVLKALN